MEMQAHKFFPVPFGASSQLKGHLFKPRQCHLAPPGAGQPCLWSQGSKALEMDLGSLIGCVTLEKLFHFSELWFPPPQNNKILTHLLSVSINNNNQSQH